MSFEELVLKNRSLIYVIIKEMHCYWRTKDELQDLYDAGLLGLIQGAKRYDPTLGIKQSTFLGRCIRNEIIKYIKLSENSKRRINKETISINLLVDNENTELIDLIPDETIDIENTLDKKLELERIEIAINMLKKEKDRDFINYYYGLNGKPQLTNKEIQEKYGVSRQMVDNRIKNAKIKIMKFLKDNEKEAFIIEQENESLEEEILRNM